MPGEESGPDVVRRARAEWPGTQVVVLTAYGTVETAVEAMKIGAFDFRQKPIAGPDTLRRLATRAFAWRHAPGPANAHPRPNGALGERAADGDSAGAPVRGLAAGILWQLKQRRVYNAGAAYAAVAVLVLQTAELIVPALPRPAVAYDVVVGAVIAGFPLALVLGRVYDITAAGLQRPPRSKQRDGSR